MKTFYRVTVRLVVAAADDQSAQQRVVDLMKALTSDGAIQGLEVGDVDEVRQTWERV
jgi:hypothetical protein